MHVDMAHLTGGDTVMPTPHCTPFLSVAEHTPASVVIYITIGKDRLVRSSLKIALVDMYAFCDKSVQWHEMGRNYSRLLL